MLIGMTSLSIFLTISLFYSVRINLSYSDKLDDVQEALQETLDILNEQYSIIDSKTKIEVFSDEPVVRSLINDMNVARDSVLKVARLLDATVDAVDSWKEEA